MSIPVQSANVHIGLLVCCERTTYTSFLIFVLMHVLPRTDCILVNISGSHFSIQQPTIKDRLRNHESKLSTLFSVPRYLLSTTKNFSALKSFSISALAAVEHHSIQISPSLRLVAPCHYKAELSFNTACFPCLWLVLALKCRPLICWHDSVVSSFLVQHIGRSLARSVLYDSLLQNILTTTMKLLKDVAVLSPDPVSNISFFSFCSREFSTG